MDRTYAEAVQAMLKACKTCGKAVETDTLCENCGYPVHVKEPDCGLWVSLDTTDGGKERVFWCDDCRDYVEEWEEE